MTPLEIGLTLFGTLLGGGIIFWMIQVDGHFRRYREEAVIEREAQANRLMIVVDEVGKLSKDCAALIHTQPNLKGLISAHNSISTLEASLESEIGAPSVRDAAEQLLVAIRGMLATHPSEGDFTADGTKPNQGVMGLADRLFALFGELEIHGPKNLALTALEARRLGELAHLLGEDGWARACYKEVASNLAPGNLASMRCLASLAKDAADIEDEAHWVAEQLSQVPDDVELLRRLSVLRPDTAERNVQRLEALGKATPADHSFVSGLKERLQGDSSDQSLAAVEAAIEQHPTVEQFLLKARIHRRRDEPLLAIDAVEEGLSLQGGRQHGESWALLARLLSTESKRLPEALKASVHACALNAGGTELILLKSELLERSGRTEDSFEWLESVLEKDPANSIVRTELSQMHTFHGRRSDAWSVLENAPNWGEAGLHIQKGRLLLADYDANRDAGHADTEILSAAESSFRDALEADRESGLAWLCLGRCQRLGNDITEATISLNRARRLMDDPLIAAEESLIALDEGRIDDAARLIDEADIIDSKSLVIPYVKGLVAAKRGHLSEALDRFNEVLMNNPHHVRARLNRITLHLLAEDVQTALDDCDWLLMTYPTLLLAKLRRGEALIQHGIFDEAEKEIRTVLTEQPENEVALTRLGACLLAQGRAEEAFIPLNNALNLNSKYPEGYYQRAMLYLEMGEVDSALSDFKMTAKLAPKHIDSLLRVAAIHHERDELEKAEIAWRKVLDADPDNKLARARLDEVRISLAKTA
ncbi:MAG: tetratricopeptide repeat protein [Candidatus Thalassarchaeaceae archaeon]|jgi:tetratricopeptide (TPR) repeat protein|nr:tetratricopeptide repeat protein [Candidatus Thalassarchaeaceae archaeon]